MIGLLLMVLEQELTMARVYDKVRDAAANHSSMCERSSFDADNATVDTLSRVKEIREVVR